MLDNNDNQEIEDEISPDDHQNTIGHWRFDSDGSEVGNPITESVNPPPLTQFDKELVNDNLFLNSNHNSKTTRSLTISIILVIIVSLMIFVIMSQFRKNINTESRNLEMNPKEESSQL